MGSVPSGQLQPERLRRIPGLGSLVIQTSLVLRCSNYFYDLPDCLRGRLWIAPIFDHLISYLLMSTVGNLLNRYIVPKAVGGRIGLTGKFGWHACGTFGYNSFCRFVFMRNGYGQSL